MLGRSSSLTASALLGAFLAVLVAASEARAHRLEADYHVLPGGKVQIESWFDLTGDSPKGARVEVFRPNGQLLKQGQLDDRGVYVFPFTDAEPLRVVVSAGAGHRKELAIPASDLARSATGDSSMPGLPGNSANSPPAPMPLADRSPRVSLKDVLAGVGFLLAVAAFALSLRNARQLRALSQRRDPPSAP